MRARGQWLWIGALALIAAFTWWLGQRSGHVPGPRVQPPSSADYYARDATIHTTDTQGRPVYRLSAAQILHFPDKHVTMSTVHLVYQAGAAPWDLTANHALLPFDDGREVDLSGHVVLRGTLEDGSPFTLTTSRMVVLTDKQRAHTDAPVLMVSAARRVKAVGMRTNLVTREVELLKDVHVRFQPQ